MIEIKENIGFASAHFTVIDNDVRGAINRVVTRGYIHKGFTKKRKRIKLKVDQSTSNFLNNLLVGNNLELLITEKAVQLSQRVADILINHPDFVNPRTNSYKTLYSIFVGAYENMDKHAFVSRIGIETCPYCNRGYTYTLDKASNLKPEIDHFYSKGIYPLLACCYYNLIPCCQTCNGIGGKHNKDAHRLGLKNPYLFSPGDLRFSHRLNSTLFKNPLIDKTVVDVQIAGLQSHINIFKLDKLYAQHSDHVLELILKSKVKYSPRYRKYLRDYRGINLSEAEIDRLIIGNYVKVEDLHKRPLSKLNRDIALKLGLIF